jgi:hypothetical protein
VPACLPIPGDDPSDPTLANRADVLAVGLLAGATFFLLALRTARYGGLRIVLAGSALTLLMPLEVRAATIGALAVLGMFALQPRWRTLISLVGLAIIAFALVSVAGVQFRARSRESTTESIVSAVSAPI